MQTVVHLHLKSGKELAVLPEAADCSEDGLRARLSSTEVWAVAKTDGGHALIAPGTIEYVLVPGTPDHR